MKLWGSRIDVPLDDRVRRLNASLSFDIRLYREDIRASRAWARALAEVGIFQEQELESVLHGLDRVRKEFEAGDFEPVEDDEDIHTAVERRLTELIGEPAAKLHTGRSRNDQVATDFRMWTMGACRQLAAEVLHLAEALTDSGASQLDTAMPGYTHLQPAQAVTWGHWAMAHAWALLRDLGRWWSVREALAVDREALAADLGFQVPSPNSLDGVSDRDFAAEFLFTGALLGVHLSRLAQQLILFASDEFGFVELDRAYTTGSSLMPQKINPDPLELARAKSGRLTGNLVSLLTALKGLPSAYDKDLQEDKEPAFDTFDTLQTLLPVLTGLVSALQIRPERMAARLEPALFATDLADYLVEKGVAFRTAHDLVGRAVRRAEELAVPLDELPLAELHSIDDRFESDVSEVFDVRESLGRRDVIGGTAPARLEQQLRSLRSELGDWGERVEAGTPVNSE